MEANGLQDSLESNEIQKRKVGLMRARVESEDPSAKVPISLLFPLFLFIVTTYWYCPIKNAGTMENVKREVQK